MRSLYIFMFGVVLGGLAVEFKTQIIALVKGWFSKTPPPAPGG